MDVRDPGIHLTPAGRRGLLWAAVVAWLVAIVLIVVGMGMSCGLALTLLLGVFGEVLR